MNTQRNKAYEKKDSDEGAKGWCSLQNAASITKIVLLFKNIMPPPNKRTNGRPLPPPLPNDFAPPRVSCSVGGDGDVDVSLEQHHVTLPIRFPAFIPGI